MPYLIEAILLSMNVLVGKFFLWLKTARKFVSNDEWKVSSFVAKDMIGQMRMADDWLSKRLLCMAFEKGFQAVTLNWSMC